MRGYLNQLTQTKTKKREEKENENEREKKKLFETISLFIKISFSSSF
jgi:hypothetical protein